MQTYGENTWNKNPLQHKSPSFYAMKEKKRASSLQAGAVFHPSAPQPSPLQRPRAKPDKALCFWNMLKIVWPHQQGAVGCKAIYRYRHWHHYARESKSSTPLPGNLHHKWKESQVCHYGKCIGFQSAIPVWIPHENTIFSAQQQKIIKYVLSWRG